MLGKSALLAAIAGKNRGLLATEVEQRAILAAVAELEERNPTPKPLEAIDKLNGQGLLKIDQFPLIKLGQIYQYIQASSSSIYNVAETSGVPYLEGMVSVAAKFVPLSDRRVKVNFERSIIGLQRLVNYRSVDEFVAQIESGEKFRAIDFNIANREQKGWLDITYLDDDLRIGRGNEGSVFVLTKA
jgi:PAP_fibrillin